MWGTIQPVTCCTGELVVELSPLNWPISYGNWALQHNSEFPGDVQSNSPVSYALLLDLEHVSLALSSEPIQHTFGEQQMLSGKQ